MLVLCWPRLLFCHVSLYLLPSSGKLCSGLLLLTSRTFHQQKKSFLTRTCYVQFFDQTSGYLAQIGYNLFLAQSHILYVCSLCKCKYSYKLNTYGFKRIKKKERKKKSSISVRVWRTKRKHPRSAHRENKPHIHNIHKINELLSLKSGGAVYNVT